MKLVTKWVFVTTEQSVVWANLRAPLYTKESFSTTEHVCLQKVRKLTMLGFLYCIFIYWIFHLFYSTQIYSLLHHTCTEHTHRQKGVHKSTGTFPDIVSVCFYTQLYAQNYYMCLINIKSKPLLIFNYITLDKSIEPHLLIFSFRCCQSCCHRCLKSSTLPSSLPLCCSNSLAPLQQGRKTFPNQL